MNKNGKRYSDEFKSDAMSLVKEGRSISSVARDLGISYQSLRNWLKASKQQQDPEASRILELEVQLKAEKKRNADLEETVAILKKATAIFATNNRK